MAWYAKLAVVGAVAAYVGIPIWAEGALDRRYSNAAGYIYFVSMVILVVAAVGWLAD